MFDSVTQMGLSEIGAVSSTVDSSETGSYNPDVIAATAVFPSSEHIPVTRAAGITSVLAVPAAAVSISPVIAALSTARLPRSVLPDGPWMRCKSSAASPWF